MLRIVLASLVVIATAALVATTGTWEVTLVLVGGLFAVAIAAWPSTVAQPPDRTVRTVGESTDPRAVIDALSEPVMLIEDNRVRIANAAARTMLGAHVVGEDVRLAIRHPAAAERLAQGGRDGTTELAGLGGRDQRVVMHVATLGNGRRLVHLVDQTGSHAAERARTDFVANSSHELRTPLAAIIGFIETLGDDEAAADAEVRKRFLDVMMKEARRMQRLIDDLISLSRIEAEKHSLPETPVDLVALAREVAGEVGQPVSLDLPSWAIVHGDRAQLSQLVHNLVGNAFKYGRQPISLRLTEDRKTLKLAVADSGDGIAPEHIPRLTERFYRVDPGRSRAQGGTGLGLAIVKHIVERHRGRLDIASELGRGTTVSVVLPTATAAVVTEESSN